MRTRAHLTVAVLILALGLADFASVIAGALSLSHVISFFLVGTSIALLVDLFWRQH
jgi:hypothetical protein